MNDSETEYRANEQGMIVEEIAYLGVRTDPEASNWLQSQPSHQSASNKSLFKVESRRVEGSKGLRV